jgi:predicted nuclease with RNAse H fold
MIYLGIDVSSSKRKRQAAALLTNSLELKGLFLEECSSPTEVPTLVNRLLKVAGYPKEEIVVAIDSPRRPMKECRNTHPGSPLTKETGRCGRQAELEIGTIYPTPCKEYFDDGLRCPIERVKGGQNRWMEMGFAYFKEFSRHIQAENLIEVFPAESYKRLATISSPVKLNLDFGRFHPKQKADQLDALCAALTAYYYKTGLYSLVGDPKEGAIVVPGDGKP